MSALVLVDDLATYLNAPLFTGTAALQASMAVDLASATVRARTGQDFTAKVADVVTLDTYGEDVFLPQRPVTAVASVVTRDRGSTVTATRVVNVDYEVRGNRLRWVGYGVWPYEVTVTYNHGYTPIPDDVRGVTLAVAAELLGNPEGLSSETIDDYTWRRGEGDEGSLVEQSLTMLARRYGRKPLTVRIG